VFVGGRGQNRFQAMVMFLVRTVEAAIYPIGLIWISLTVGAFTLYRKKQRGAAFFCGFFSAFLYLIGATPIPELLLARLERTHGSANIASAPAVDAVVVLGGFINSSSRDAFEMSFTPAADRIVTGLEILRQNKARGLIIGGGGIGRGARFGSEGERVAQFVKTWRVASGEVIGLPPCSNTHDEAMNTLALLPEHHWTNLILVTSAYHMPRALATFEKAGLKVRPVACDFEALSALEKDGSGFRVVPVIEHVQNLTLYLHEVIGWYYYAFRGWI
jgi:uncharacterized SAM-binding protein YcdF (DUF218 family)